MRKLKLAFLLLAVMPLMSGCNAAADASKTQQVIAGILNIVNAELAAGVIPPADVPAVTAWYNLGVSLNGQLSSCITSATAGDSKSSGFLACFNAFDAGLLSPSELATLRIISPTAQSKVQLWATAIALALNVALPEFGGATVTTPVTVSSLAPAPTHAELEAFRVELKLSQQ